MSNSNFSFLYITSNIFRWPNKNLAMETAKVFGIPAGVIPVAAIVFGKKGMEMKPGKKYCEEKVHFEKW